MRLGFFSVSLIAAI